MSSDVLESIAQLTPDDYIHAFEVIQPTERQWEMLRIHMSAPDQIITAGHLASALGFLSWRSANLHYGKFAGKICAVLNINPSTNLAVLVGFYKTPGLEWELQLRPAVIDALVKLGFSEHTYRLQEEYGQDTELVEGAAYTVQVNAYERNPVARQRCIQHYGESCAVCGFNFGATFGEAASGYTHIHHLTPLATIGQEYVVDPIQDLRPVCANCHAVIHMRTPAYTLDEVKAMRAGAGGA